jgi:4-hydroxy-tetrahydrodipicolinate synthase
MITPFDESEEVDYNLLEKDVKHLVEKCARARDLILGLKDRGTIFSAVDALLYPSYALGAHGAIAAILTAVPELCVKQWDQVQKGDHEGAIESHNKLLTIWNAISGDNLPANVRYAMELQGRLAGIPRAPMPASSEQQQKQIRKALKQTGIIS